MSSETAVADKAPVKTVAEAVLEGLRALSPEEQAQVLRFIEDLREKQREAGRERRSLEGLWADLGVHITEEDIAEARREMWGNFPREHLL